MTDYLKPIVITQLAIAILILPSSAFVACDCSAEDPDWGNFSSLYEAQTCYVYSKSPVAYDSNVTISEGTLHEITLNATDPDGDMLTYDIGSGPFKGTLVAISGNKVVYISHENFTGFDSFTFRVNDGNWDSNTATVTITVEPPCSSQLMQVFYGTVTIDGKPAPENTMIMAVGPGVLPDIAGNPVTTQTDGFFGSSDITAQRLVVQGCIENGTPITFYADGVPAEVYEVNASALWQSAYPFKAGEVTNLEIRVPQTIPPPDEVYINALSMTITNATYGFSSTIKLKKDPWIEARVTRGMFNVKISATGVHRFSPIPEMRRDATLGIYENGIPVSSEKNVWFGSKVVNYDYVATDTRTFDILIYVNENPEIHDVKHITIYAVSDPEIKDITATAGPGGISPQ